MEISVGKGGDQWPPLAFSLISMLGRAIWDKERTGPCDVHAGKMLFIEVRVALAVASPPRQLFRRRKGVLR